MSLRSFKRAQARRIARERRRATVLARRGALIAGTALSATTLFAASAQAATYTVTTTGDDNGSTACTGTAPGPYQCTTLRDAITTANGNGQFTNTIDLGGLSGTIALTNGAFNITGGALTITGPGAGNLAIDAGSTSQIFTIGDVSEGSSADGTVSITGLTMDHGASGGDGGTIYNDGTGRPLTLDGDTIENSTADSYGGGLYTYAAPLTISNSTLTGDTAPTGRGGAVYAEDEDFKYSPVALTNDTISNNSAESGGGVWDTQAITISGGTITQNTATDASGDGGGGVYISSKYGSTITGGAVISNNTSAADGGGVVLSTDYFDRYATEQIVDSTVTGNTAPIGAGVAVPNGDGNIQIHSSTLSDNKGAGTSYGGGLAVGGDVIGKVELSNSTISGNTATNGAGVSLGGPYNEPLTPVNKGNGQQGKIDLANSTIAGNTASGHGGGIFLGEYTTNSGGPEYSGGAALNSTIVAGNSDSSGANDLYRVPQSTSGGFGSAFSLIQNPGNAPLTESKPTILNQNPQLGPLQANGGPTQTMMPSSTSPVIDQGHSPTGPSFDQRGPGYPRTVDTAIPNPPGGDGTDIGAVELAANQVSTPATGAGFSVSLRNTPLGPKTSPLLVDDQTPVSCTVQVGVLQTCLIEVYKGKTLLARGQATNPVGTKRLTLLTHVTKAGLYNYKHHPLGQNVTVEAIGDPNAPGTRVLFGKAHLLALPKITLALPVRTAKISAREASNYKTVARMLKGVKHTTCTAYTDKPPNDNPAQDLSLTRAQAKAACVRMKKDGLTGTTRFVGRGTAKPLESNASAKLRVDNRRVVITWSF